MARNFLNFEHFRLWTFILALVCAERKFKAVPIANSFQMQKVRWKYNLIVNSFTFVNTHSFFFIHQREKVRFALNIAPHNLNILMVLPKI